ncbi:unnamed protein product [Orchesella dallaii]|uniref:Uncharacterized protein n=1 Tax=Orchesella dallaii TaxID=48710 RepID=A0ABP1QY31_9HEXA
MARLWIYICCIAIIYQHVGTCNAAEAEKAPAAAAATDDEPTPAPEGEKGPDGRVLGLTKVFGIRIPFFDSPAPPLPAPPPPPPRPASGPSPNPGYPEADPYGSEFGEMGRK